MRKKDKEEVKSQKERYKKKYSEMQDVIEIQI